MDKKLPRIYLLATLTVALFSTQSLVGQSLSFDGEDDYVNYSNSTDFDVVNELTITAWIKTNEIKNTKIILIEIFFI